MSKLFYTMVGPPRFGVVNFALAVFLCPHTHNHQYSNPLEDESEYSPELTL